MITVPGHQTNESDQPEHAFLHVKNREGDVAAVIFNGPEGPGCQLLSPDGDVVGDLRLNSNGQAQLALFWQGRPRAVVFLAPDGSPMATGFDDQAQLIFTFNPSGTAGRIH